MHQPLVYKRKIEAERVFVRATAHTERTGFVLGWCGHMLIVAWMESSDWVNLCAPDSARNREGGHGTYSWLGSRQAVQSCRYMRDKPISTASVAVRFSEGALGQNAGIQMCHLAEVNWGFLCHELVLLYSYFVLVAPLIFCTLSFVPHFNYFNKKQP